MVQDNAAASKFAVTVWWMPPPSVVSAVSQMDLIHD